MTTLPPTALSFAPMPPSLAARYPSLPGDASWTALLADTSSDLGGLARWKVKVQQEPHGALGRIRLIVHAYRRSDVLDGQPAPFAKPLASTQRATRAEELSQGVVVELMHFSDAEEDSVVLAWTEAGDADLDFDGLETRPDSESRFAETIPLPIGALRAKYLRPEL